MHQDHTIINQKKRNRLQREQVRRSPTQNQQKEHQVFPRSRKLQLLPKVQLCRKIHCPAPVPVMNYLQFSCNRPVFFFKSVITSYLLHFLYNLCDNIISLVQSIIVYFLYQHVFFIYFKKIKRPV